jgi:hypothetical protein
MTKKNPSLAIGRTCAFCGENIDHKRLNAKFCNRSHKNKSFDMKRDHHAEYWRNVETRRAQSLGRYYADHEKSKKNQLEKQKLKPEIAAASTAKRRALKLQRTPLWLTDFDKLKIKCLYSVASMLTRENKEPWHVDHVIPLQGKFVSGLHVPFNMRVLRGKENISKHNNFEVA